MIIRSNRRTPSWRLVSAAVLATAAVAVLSACSGPDTATAPSASSDAAAGLDSAASEQIASALDVARAAPEFVDPGPAFDASGLEGKRIFVLSDGTNEFLSTFATGFKGAAESLGVTVEEGNGNSNNAEDVRLLSTAVNQGFDAIVIVASDPIALASGVGLAKDAGIPVIQTFQGDAGAPSAEAADLGVAGHVSFCYTCAGELMAASELEAWGADTRTYLQQLAGFPSSDAVVAGYTGAMEKWCPECEVTLQDIPITTDNSTQVSSAAQTAAQDPATTTIATVFDYMLSFSEPIVRSAGAIDRIHLVSENASLAQLKALKQGAPYAANVGASVEWAGWATMDQVARVLLDVEGSDDPAVPLRLFDATNIADVDLDADASSWYVTDFKSAYEELWSGE